MTFDYDKYECGEHVEVYDNNRRGGRSEGESWREGIVVRIDYGDDQLPWAVSLHGEYYMSTLDSTVQEILNHGDWSWYPDDLVRSSHYLDKNFVIQEEVEVPW